MSIPMVCLHNLGKSSCRTPAQFQCASWFWQSQHRGCVSNEDVTSQLSGGSGLAKWLFDISWGWMGWFVTNYSYLYTWRNSSFLVRLFWLLHWHCLLWLYCVLAGSDASFWQSGFLCIVSAVWLLASLAFWLPIFIRNFYRVGTLTLR